MLLLVFALAITPKLLMHDAITSHKHQFSPLTQESAIIKSSFVCDCENLVAESVFVDCTDPIIVNPPAAFSVFTPKAGEKYHPLSIHSFRLRGPPAAFNM